MSDAAGACTYFNRTWLEFTDRPLEREIGDGWTEGIHPEDRELIRRHWREALVSREPFESEYRLRRHDGVYRWVLDIGSPRLLRDGTVVGWIGSVIDITERREAALALQEQEARQRAFLVDILASVTEGKFRLCGSAADLPGPLPPVSDSIPLDKAAMRNLRNAAQAAAAALGMSEERAQDLLTAVGEAGMNAVRHGGGGTGRICAGGGVIQVWTEDRGKGIDLKNLPRAVAERGYTTGGGFGHGFFLMISSVDRVYLLTGPEGTTVVLEQGVEPPAPAWLTAKGTAADW